MDKFKYDKNYKCPKCGIDNGVGSTRSINYLPQTMAPTGVGGSLEESTPECVQVSCGCCGFAIGKFAPVGGAQQLPA